ncbi:hypothetical protein E1292_32640 [Nonomuraea deserti]|uniref:Uncharacterized protein n=1 Tax=Nonomuraea deserti TaxID=1848322 RepID=A0A4R4V261_9ACTN|nr:hypothetical protein [Nonomuraea deserti]TDC99198.1 hypothetical protein E1292_32640 [Nonomuraea deserti]
MLRNHLRRDLQWLKRQARKDRRITAVLLVCVAAVWARQLSPWETAGGAPLALLGISFGLVAGSAMAWLTSACFVARTLRTREEPAEELRWISRIGRAKEWAFWSLAAYVAWHLLQLIMALVLL